MHGARLTAAFAVFLERDRSAGSIDRMTDASAAEAQSTIAEDLKPNALTGAAARRRRRSVRRALTVECQLECECWDAPVLLRATDVSTEGLWIETPYALDPGQELVVSFRIPEPCGAPRLWAIAEVARVGMWRRRGDAHPVGMGLRFTYLNDDDRVRLEAALLGRPPRLPSDALETLESLDQDTEQRAEAAEGAGLCMSLISADNAELPIVLRCASEAE